MGEPKTPDEWVIARDEEYDTRFAALFFATKEAAIAAAPGELGLQPGDAFWVGRAKRWRCSDVDAYRVLEHEQEKAGDDCGDFAEDYLEGVTKEQRAELQAELTAVFAAWLKRHSLDDPGFFSVTDEETHTAPAVEPPHD